MTRSLTFASVALVCTAAWSQSVTITPAFKASQYLPRSAALELRLSRVLTPGDGRLAVFIDHVDMTPLFAVEGERVIYRPEKLPLPAGEHQVIVYLVPDEGAWTEIGRTGLKVLTRRGFEKALVEPGADFTGKAQPLSEASPSTNQPPRSTFQDGTLQMTVSTDHVRSGYSIVSRGQITGVTYRNEALRFAQEGDDAPRIDLSAYRIDLQRGTTILSVGHLGYGSLRHLVNGFPSRGVTLKFGEGRMVSLQLAALNGSNIVGWDNFLGLSEQDHRVLGATVGLEAIPTRPGGLRLELTRFGGSILPFTGFNQGAVRTAERSDGIGLRVVASHPSRRFTLDAGYTGSRFREARDSQVEDGLVVTRIPTRTNTAQYLDASFILLQNRMVRKVPVNLTLTARHERIEPLFRSVGTFVQADLQTNAVDLTGSVGQLTAQLTHLRSRDNLGGIESILTTRTERSALMLGIPISNLVRSKKIKAAWFPTLTLQTDLTHQFGAGIPINSGFDARSVPDQMSSNAFASMNWQREKFSVGFRLGRSNQDNRQTGREGADFSTDTNALTFGFTPIPRFNATVDVAFDQNENDEQRQRDRTRRYGTTFSWTLFGQTALGANVTTTTADNNFGTRDQRGTVGYLEVSSGFGLTRPVSPNRQGRLFLRYSEQRDLSRDRLFGFDSDRRSSTVTSGVTLTVR